MNRLINLTDEEANPASLQKRACTRHNMLKTFKCPQCELIFDRASQMSYHYRSIHLGEKSQICQICGKGFFRKADLRTHLNIHLGTNVCICEVCGRKFNHISNLIRHCRVHAGIKPYLCSICDRRFTQISSLVRHKRIIHGISKQTMRQYCNTSLMNNKLQAISCALNENEMLKNRYCERICMELISLKTSIEPAQKDKIIFNQDNIDINNKAIAACLPLEAVVLVTSKQFGESNLAEIENTNRLSQNYLSGIQEKLDSVDSSINDKAIVSDLFQDSINNHEQAQSKDSVIYLHQHDKNSLTFLPRDRGPNAELQVQADENEILKSGDLTIHTTCDFKASTNDDSKSLNNMETNLEMCDFNEISSVDQKFLYKPICKEVINESRKCDKLSNDDNQLYIELSDLGLFKFDEAQRYYNNTDSVGINLSYAPKSQHPTNIIANEELTYRPVTAQDQDNLAHNRENVEDNSSNEEPMLRLVQTETGEQFYEFIISDLVERIQNASCANNLENEAEELPNAFGHCQGTAPNLREKNEKSNRAEHQQTLEDLADINNEFNYTQFDFHREEKGYNISFYDGHFESSLRDNECTDDMQEKSMQTYNSENLGLLENESHVDFDKYVETNLEAFERLNYENCNEKLFEFVEVADIGIESSGYKESSMVCLIQNEGEQLLELLRDSQTEQESSQDFTSVSNLDDSTTSAQQDNNKIVDHSESKSDFSYVENNLPLEENININQDAMENKEQHVNSSNCLYADRTINETTSSKNCVQVSKEVKKPKTSLKKFQCSVCRKAFSTAYNHKQHIGIHFTDQQKFHCKECGASFAWKSTLNKHLANSHSSDGPQKFVCEICPRVYSTLSQVNDHVKRDHLKQRNHVCSHCGKSFFKSFDLKIHSRTHTDERPYACRICGKRFHHQSHIIRHERTHSGERPYACDVCQKTFTQHGSLKTHKQTHRQIRMDILGGYQIDEDDPIALTKL